MGGTAATWDWQGRFAKAPRVALAAVPNLDDLRGQIDEQCAEVDRASRAEGRQVRRMRSEQRRSQAQDESFLGKIRQATNTTDEEVADVVKRVSAMDT